MSSSATAAASSSVQSSNPNPNFNFNEGFDCSFLVSKSGSDLLPGRSRRKPRLFKLRKQSSSGPQIKEPKESSRVDPILKNVSFSKSDCTSLNSNSDNLDTVFGANKSDFSLYSGAKMNRSNGVSFENVDRMGKSGNEGFVFGDSKNYSGLNLNLENLGFAFGANNNNDNNISSFEFNSKSKNENRTNKNSSVSYSNVLNEEPACSESSCNSRLNLEFGERKSSSGNVGQPQVDQQSESPKSEQSGGFHFGRVANGSTMQSHRLKANFEFGASRPNFDLGNGERKKGEAVREAESQESQGPILNGAFVFKANENGKLAEDPEKFNREKTQNHNGLWGAQKYNLGADLPKSSIFKLSDEMNSLNIGSAPVGGAENTSEKSRVNIQNIFVFGCNQQSSNVSTESSAHNSCDLPKYVNVKDLGSSCHVDKADTGDGEPNTKKTNSFSFSAGTSGKENQPIIFNSTTGSLSELQQNILNSDTERDKMPFPSFTPEGFGSQHKVDTPEAPSGHQAEKNEEFSFPSMPFTPGKPFSDFNASDSNKSFSFTANLFSGVNEKLGCGTSSKLRDKKVKKKKPSRQRTLVQQLAGQTDLSNESSSKNNNESPGCCSPMDFSPYQDSHNGAAEIKDDVVSSKEELILNGSEKSCGERNGNILGTDSGKNSDTQRDFSSYTSPSAQDGLSSIRRQYRKKYKLKVDSGSNNLNHRKVNTSPDAVQRPFGHNRSADTQSGVTSHVRSKGNDVSKDDEDHGKVGLTDRDFCEQWRIRGNQAYKAGNHSQAEDFYTKGIKSVSTTEISGSCLEPLLLCYSNRAATRMSLRRMREAISDCASAAALDPQFLKVKLRAANCYLVLGEVEEAIQYYNNCLESRINLCLDRRITIDAADGLQKAKEVSEHMHRCAEFLQQRSLDTAKRALEITNKALSISCYSEKLLEMKGEAFCMLQMYNEVIELCENTLDIAEKNFTSDLANSSLRLWRWHLMSRAHFHLGKLETALGLIEKQEQLVSAGKRSGNKTQESSPLAATIRELLHRKKAGNEAFKSGKYTEAIEHYTAAISSSVESRPFAAICFCNRAAAHQALGQIVDAIADCSVAIALDKNYTKAVSRRATLHEMIRDYEHAVNDLERLITLQEIQSQERTRQSEALDKSNGSSAKEAKRIRRQLSSIQEKAKRGVPLDLYLILGIKSSDTESDIKKAYRKAALRHHPDKAGQILAKSDGGDDGGLWKEISETVRKDADRLFKLIGEAHAVLSDFDKRSKHDLAEEIRDVQRDSMRKSDSCRPSDSYSSPFERTNWFRRQSNFYSSPFGRSGSGRYGQEYWRTYGESHPRW